MKHRVICFITILFIATLTFPAFATTDTSEYYINELGLTLSIPSDLVVFTRDTTESDPNLSKYGLTKESMLSYMTSQNLYLNALDQHSNFEIIVTMTDDPLKDWNLYTDEELLATGDAFAPGYKEAGLTYIKSEIYQHKQAKFLKVYSSQLTQGITVYILQYYTVYASKAINLTIRSSVGEIDANDESLIKAIIDSAKFDTDPTLPEGASASATTKYEYTDSETGVSFNVPPNWSETPLSAEQNFNDAEFTSNVDTSTAIFYGSKDLWAELTPSDRDGLTRAEYNNSILTKADIALIFSVPESEVRTVSYNGIEYYRGDPQKVSTLSGDTVNIPVTLLLHIENGYMYMFQFYGGSDSPLFPDFEAVMESVTYPTAPLSEGAAPAASTDVAYSATTAFNPYAERDLMALFNPGILLANLLFTIIIYSLPIIIYRYGIKKAPVERKTAKKITIIYGIFAFIVAAVLVYLINGGVTVGGAVFLWSFINYRVLIGGKREPTPAGESPVPTWQSPASGGRMLAHYLTPMKDVDPTPLTEPTWNPTPPAGQDETNPQALPPVEEINAERAVPPVEEIPTQAPLTRPVQPPETEVEPQPQTAQIPAPPQFEARYCHKCGERLFTGSLYCIKCGAEIP